MFKEIGFKVQLSIISTLVILSVIGIMLYKANYEEKINNSVLVKANKMASMSQNTMDLLMVTGMISDVDTRKLFFKKTNDQEGIEDFRVFRSHKVNDIAVDKGLPEEQPQNEEDKEVLKTGEVHMGKIIKKDDKYTISLVYPYLASKNFKGTNCMSCHFNVKEGEAIGGTAMTLDVTQEMNELSESIKKMVIAVSIIILIVILVISVILTKMVKRPMRKFENGLLGFFDYLNHKKDSVELIDLKTGDEFEKLSDAINENIKISEENINKDRNLIKETNQVLQEVIGGNLKTKIYSKSETESLNELVESFNHMIEEIDSHFNNINTTLYEYTHYDYTKELTLNNIKNGSSFEILEENINGLRTAIVDMLKENEENGKNLLNYSKSLQSNVETLSHSTSEGAGQLEEVSASLEDLTNIANENSGKVNRMSQISTEVTKNAESGNKMAENTKSAMDEINEKVEAINNAIVVIDQIAFQTNILSLNAAVEAATAGEHGKGFAVVAQEVRNLAAKSAEAANDIKELVEAATQKTTEGKKISDEMIEGYKNLIENINQTISLIGEVENGTEEQKNSVVQINESVRFLDEQTQKNAEISNSANEVAQDTNKIAQSIVNNTESKKFK